MTEQQAVKRIKDEIGWESSELNREAFEMGVKALEKQIPKKPTIDEFDYGEGYICPKCESFLHYVKDDDEHYRTNYCLHCGTKLDWGNEDAE